MKTIRNEDFLNTSQNYLHYNLALFGFKVSFKKVLVRFISIKWKVGILLFMRNPEIIKTEI